MNTDIKSHIKDLERIVKDIDKKVDSCDLRGIGKDMFEANRIICTLVSTDAIGIFTGQELSQEERTKLTELKVKYDNSLNNIGKCNIKRKGD